MNEMLDDIPRCVDDLNDLETMIYNSIIIERDAQKIRHEKDQAHPPALWIAIIVKQLGQASDQVIRDDIIDVYRLEKQLVQIAAVAVAWLEVLENMDTNK